MCTLFYLVDIKKRSFLTSCVFWFVFLNASSHLCFQFPVILDYKIRKKKWKWRSWFCLLRSDWLKIIYCTKHINGLFLGAAFCWSDVFLLSFWASNQTNSLLRFGCQLALFHLNWFRFNFNLKQDLLLLHVRVETVACTCGNCCMCCCVFWLVHIPSRQMDIMCLSLQQGMHTLRP